jgi:hypothetical protein
MIRILGMTTANIIPRRFMTDQAWAGSSGIPLNDTVWNHKVHIHMLSTALIVIAK